MKKAFGMSAINYPLIIAAVFCLVSVVIVAGSAVPRAVAHATASPCVLITGSDASAVSVTGSSKIDTSGCALTVLSNASPAVSLTGASKINSGAVCAKSVSVTGASKITPNFDSSCAAGNDPFASEQVPVVGKCDFNNVSYTNSSKNTLQPGVYCGNVTLAGSTKETFAPGVYIFKDSNLIIDGSAQVSGTGVALFFTGTGGGLTVGGSAKLSITAPATGALAGFAVYMDPAAHPAAQSSLSGSSQLTLEGTTYLPTQPLSIVGSSKVVSSNSATFVLRSLSLSGSTNFKASGAFPTGPAPDTVPPVINPHDDITVTGTSAGAVVSYSVPTSTDDIDGAVPVSCTPASGSLFAFGSTTVTCIAHDAAGNNATPVAFVVYVVDKTAPTIAAHGDITVAGDLSGVNVTYTSPTATDDIDTAVNVSCTPASGSLFAFGSTTVTCSAHDSSGNSAAPSTFVVYVTDQAAPVIAAHDNISVVGTSQGTVVTYDNPIATDNVDTNVEVICAPASGSTFSVGSTTVLCNAHDAAGNAAAATSFEVDVTVPPPMPFTMASQPDESFLCSPDWENCFTGGAGQASIKLGLGSTLGTGTLLSITIAKDENSPFASQPWILQLQCFTDPAYTISCPDWVQGKSWNAGRTDLVSEFATSTADNKHWTAYFTDPSHEANSNGSSPVIFNPGYYYQLNINDNGWNIGAYGTTTPAALPYYQITGMTL